MHWTHWLYLYLFIGGCVCGFLIVDGYQRGNRKWDWRWDPAIAAGVVLLWPLALLNIAMEG